MKKADLKTGMRVRVGGEDDYGIILLDTDNSDVIIYYDSYDPLCNFNDDLSHITKPSYDINEILNCPSIIKYSLDFKVTGSILWERKAETPIFTHKGVEWSEQTLKSMIDSKMK